MRRSHGNVACYSGESGWQCPNSMHPAKSSLQKLPAVGGGTDCAGIGRTRLRRATRRMRAELFFAAGSMIAGRLMWKRQPGRIVVAKGGSPALPRAFSPGHDPRTRRGHSRHDSL